jgi:hypothetical protein
VVLFKTHMMSCKRHRDIEVQFDTLWSRTSQSSSELKKPKPLLEMVVIDAIKLLISMLVLLMRKQLIA